MGDAELRLGVHHNVLRGHAAGPEHRCFAGVDGHGVAEMCIRDSAMVRAVAGFYRVHLRSLGDARYTLE